MKNLVKKAGKALVPAAAAGAGAVSVGFLVSKIPVADQKAKAGIIMAGGLLLTALSKKPADIMHNAGLGVFAGGAILMAKEFGIAGVGSSDPIMDLSGQDIEGDDDIHGAESPLNGAEDAESELA